MAKQTKRTPSSSAGQPAAAAAPASNGDTGNTGNPAANGEPIELDQIEERLSSLLQAQAPAEGGDPTSQGEATPEGEPSDTEEHAREVAAGTGEPEGELGAQAPGATEGDQTAGAEPGAEEEDLSDTPEWYQKRIKKFTAREKELKEQIDTLQDEVAALRDKPVETRPAAAPNVGDSPVANLNSEEELQAKQVEVEQLMETVDDLLIALPRNPDAVARRLRADKIVLQDESGAEDFTPERMEEYLRTVRRNLDKMGRVHIPARRQHLAAAKKFEAAAAKDFPFLADRKSPEYAVAQEVLAYFPGIKARPDWKMIVGVQTLGLLALRKARAGKGKIQPPPAAGGRTAPRPSVGQVKPAPADPDRVKLSGARERMLKQGDPTDYIRMNLGKLPTYTG